MNKMDDIKEFLSKKNLAVIGVSRSGKKFGDTIFNELKSREYNLFPVNPAIDKYNGIDCFPDIKSIPQKIEAAILVVKPEVTEQIIPDIIDSGVKLIWMQQGSVSKKAVEYCTNNSAKVIADECVLMFAEPVKSIHGFHRWLWKIFNKLPK